MPNRIIKESICRSDQINGLTAFEEVLFYRLMVSVDDFGRYDGRQAIRPADRLGQASVHTGEKEQIPCRS